MAKTALELTVQEWKAYQPGRALARRPKRASPQQGQRRRQAWRVARRAALLLRNEFGANRVVAFGSLARRKAFTDRSDIDLAAWGIPEGRYFAAVAAVTGLSPLFRIDLVDPQNCPSPSVRQAIETEGVEL